MNLKLLKRLALDLVITLLILLAFAYQLTANTVHELIGISIVVLFLVHNLLNWRWYPALAKGKYSPRRLANTTANLLLLALAVLVITTGLLNSHLLASVLQTEWNADLRDLHMAGAYWLLIVMSVHLGMHWKMIMSEVGEMAGITRASRSRTMALRLVSALVVAYGVKASCERNLLAKLTAYYAFDFWSSEESILGFFAGLLGIIGVFVSLTHYALKWQQKRAGRTN